MTLGNGSDDRDLRERFARSREADRAQMPAFAAVVARAPARARARGRLAIGVAMAAALVVAAFVARDRIARSVGHVGLPTPTHWRSPTDFLLEIPGDELLRTTPAFGSCFIAVSCHPAPSARSGAAAPFRG